MKTIILKKLANGGLYLSGPNDTLPEGFMRRFRGVSAFAQDSAISRDGSDLIHSLNAHSLKYFSSTWHSGVSTSFYVGTTETVTGLSGNRLSFSAMAPTAGVVDYLFVAGGGDLFKIDSSGDDTDWGIDPPSVGTKFADGGSGGALTDGAIYKYKITHLNSVTGTRSNPTSSIGGVDTNVVLMLHMDGADGSTTFVDDSDTGHTVTANGNVQITTDYNVNNFLQVGAFSGVAGGDYLSLSDHADWDYGAGNLTIDTRARLASTAVGPMPLYLHYEDDNNYAIWYLSGSTSMYLQVQSGGSYIINISGAVSLNTEQWYHFALIRGWNGNANDWAMTRDGTVLISGTDASAWPSLTGSVYIGYENIGGTDTYFQGWLDEYRISSGIARWTESFKPETQAYDRSVVDLAGGSTSIDLTNITQSSDAQVDTIELWRTFGGGTAFFRAALLPDGTTSYTDDRADADLESLELPLDNLKPYSWFDDCYGPWNASMFWITRTQAGERGRVYYSPIGRAEAVAGFIEVTSDDDGLQSILAHAGNLFVWSKSRVFQIYGTNPYFSREISGVPGTIAPHTTAITPLGPMYESQDGVRIFVGGAQSQLVAYDQVKPIFRGRTVENIASFSGTVATFARGEYIISDGTNTLALNVETLRWRDLGVGCNALAYSPASDQIAATVSSTILDFEKEGEVDDNSAAIALDLLTNHMNFVPPAAIELIRIDANSGTNTIACAAYLDDSSTAQGNLSTTAGRRWSEFTPGARLVNRLGIRLSGSLTAAAEIFAIEISYWPMVLGVFVGDQVHQIPGRLSGDRQTLTFEAFSDAQDLLQSTYVFERLFYDLDSASNNVVVTLTLINETPIALGTLNTATRTVSEINITKKGRFQKLVLAGDFTAAIALRCLELTAKTNRRP